MNRRALLAGAGSAVTASVAGCLDNLVSDARVLVEGDRLATVESASIRTYSPQELPEWYLDFEELVFTPSEYDLAVDVDVTTTAATPETPASIEVTTEYDGTGPLSYESGGDSYLLSNTSSSDSELLLIQEDDDIDREDEDCWRVNTYWGSLVLYDVTLRPGQRNQLEFDIVSMKDACYPTGEFELVQRYPLADDSHTAIYWGIVLELS